MEPADNSLDQTYAGSAYDSSLEAGNSADLGSFARQRSRLNPFGLNRKAFLVTGFALGAILFIGLGSLVLGGFSSHKKSTADSSQPAANYAVSSLPIEGLKASTQLQLGQADHLAINGQLQVNNTLVLTPTGKPTSPTAGQIYFDQTTNQPYYYDGTQFVGLTPTAIPQHVTSLGGLNGSIGLGDSLQVSGNQLSVSSNLLQAISNAGITGPKVSSIQGLSGDVTLSGGTGISISGTTITNSGVVGLTSSDSSIAITPNGNGSYDLVAVQGGPGSQAVLLAPVAAQPDNSNGPSQHINKTGVGDFLEFANNAIDSFVVSQTGQITTGTINYSQVLGTPVVVNSIGGVSGTISLGAGLSVVGSTVSNSGVTGLSGTANQVTVSAATGNVTLSLPQDIAATSTPTFGGQTLNGALSITAGGATIAGNLAVTGASTFTVGSGTITFGSLGAGVVQSNGSGVLSSGSISVANGGTGAASFTANGVLYGNGSSPVLATAAAANSVLATNGSNVPSLTQTLPTAVQGNITGTGALSSGSISSGFGVISTANNIITSAAVQGGTLSIAAGAYTVNGSGNIVTTGSATVQGVGGLSLGVAGSTGGSLIFANAANLHLTTLQGLAPAGQNQTITIPASSAASDTVCLLTLGNCVGSGGAVTASAGTQNYLTKFTNAAGTQIGNSLVFDNGTSVGVGTAIPSASYVLDVNGNLHASGTSTLDGNATFSGNVTQSGSGTFGTGTGAVSLNGNTSVSGSNSFTSGSGAVTLNGNTSITANNTLSVGTGTTTLGGTLTVTGLATLNGGTAVTGATTINTSGSASTTIGNASSAFSVSSSGFNVTTLGAVTGVTTLVASGAITAATSSNTINGLVVNGGSLSSVTGFAQTSGNFSQSGAGSFGTGTGAVSLNGATTVSSTLAVQGAGGLTVGVAGSTIGSINLANSSSSRLAVLQAANPSGAGNSTFTLPSIAGGSSDTICLVNLGNCAGSGSGVTTAGGTVNVIPKFSGAQSVTNSAITDDGTTVTVSEALSATSVTTSLIQSAGAMSITPGGNLTIGVTNHILALQGNGNSTFTATAGGFTESLGFTTPTANRTINLPDESGTVCLQSSTNCGFALSGSGVTSLNGLSGVLSIANATGSGSTVTIQDASTAQKGIAKFNASDFSAALGVIDTIQGITTTSAVQFASLTLGTGDLTFSSATAAVHVNKLIHTANGNNITIDAGSDNIVFSNGSGANTFLFPTSGGAGQVICTSGITCASGGGQAVILEPSGVQTANGNLNTIFVNKAAGTGNLIKLQAGGSDALVIDNTGNTTISNTTTITALQTNSITPTAALTIGATSKAFTLQGTGSSLVSATGGGFITSLGFGIGSGGTAPTGNVTYQLQNDNTVAPGTYTICTSAGNCAGVGGSVTTSGGTAGKLAKFTASSNIADSIISDNGTTVTVAGNLAVGTSGASQLSIGVASSVNGTLVFNNSSNANTTTLQLAAAPAANRTISLPNQSGTVAVSASGPLSLNATTGDISCATCLTSGGGGAGGVTSLNTLTGVLSINNVTTSGGNTIIIDNAKADASTKGIATFNATNFSDNGSGTINTVQDIAAASSPTFANLTLQGVTGLTVGSASNLGQIITRDGSSAFSSTLSPATLTANRSITIPNASGTLAVSASGNLSLSAAGALSISNSPTFTTSVTTPALLSAGTLNITPGGALTVGATGQSFTMQGNAASVFTATSGSFTTTVGFTTPTANRSLSFPDEGGTLCVQNSVNCGFALSGSGVISLNSQTGAVNIANASGGSGTVTINNAKADASTKGISTFNASNFSDNGSGTINTIQNIAAGASPTFAGLTLSSALTVANGGTGAGTFTSKGIIFGNGTGVLQVTAAAANSILVTDGSSNPSLSQTLPTAVQGNITSTGALTAGSIASGFGTISTTSTISTTVALQAGSLSVASGAFTVDGSGNVVTSGTAAVQASGGLTIGVAGTTTGNLNLANSSSSRLVDLQGLNPSGAGNATIQIPSVAGGTTDTICLLSLGNCAGAGSGVTTSGGTQNYITKYNNAGANQISNSQVFDNGSFVGVNTTTNSGQLSVVASGSQSAFFLQGPGSGSNATAIIKSGAGTGDLLDLENSGGVPLVTFDGSGNLVAVGATFSGNVSQTGSGSFGTGTGAVSLNGDTTIAGIKTFSVGTGATTLGGTLGVTGLSTLSGGATITGATGITGTVTINTTGTANTTIGNATGTFAVTSAGLNLTAAGAVTGVTTFGLSGAITGATAGNTINGLVINGGALSSVAGIASSGAYTQTGSGANTFSGATSFTAAGTALTITNDASLGGALAVQGANGLTIGVAGSTAGNLKLANAGSSRLVILQGLNPSGAGNATVQIPTIAGGATDTVCLQTLSNCAAGGGSFIQNLKPSGGTAQSGNFYLQSNDATGAVTAAIRNIASQTGDLLDFQDSSGVAIGGFTAAGALSFVGANTVSTTSGTLTLQGGGGTVSLGSSTTLTASGALSISSGGATNLTLDTGGAATLGLGTTNASIVSIGNSTAATAVNINAGSTGLINLNQNVTIASDKGLSVGYSSTGSATAIQVANNTVGGIFTVDNTSTNRVTIGAVGGCAGGLAQSRLCLNQTTTGAGTGTSGDQNITNTITNSGTGATIYSNLIYLNDTGTATANSDNGLFIDSSATTNNGSTVNGLIIKNRSLNAGNLIDLQVKPAGSAVDVVTVSNTGLATFQAQTASATAFNVQNTSGNTLLAVDTSGSQVTLGKASTLAGKLNFLNATNGNNITVISATTGNGALTLPAETGTVCTNASGGACSALGFYIQNQNTGTQASSNFIISGSGTAVTSFLTPLLDTPSGTTTLNIGTTNASSGINLNQNTTLAVDKKLSVSAAAAATTVFSSQVTGDTNPRFTIGADGKLSFGGGSGAADVTLFRSGVGVLQTNNSFLDTNTLAVASSNPGISKLYVQPGSSTIAQVNRGAAGQTADLLQFQDVNGATLSKFDASGALTTNGTNTTLAALATPAVTSPSATGTNFYYAITATNAAGETVISNVLNMNANNSVINWTQIPGATGYKIYRHAATNDFTSATCTGAGGCLIQTITNGTTVTFTDAANALSAGAPPTAPTGTKLVVQGWQGQGANNSFEVQTSAGVVKAQIDSNGTASFGTSTKTGRLNVSTANDAVAGLVVFSNSGSQSANLFELRDSTGTLLNAAFGAQGNQLTLGRIASSGAVTQGKLVLSDGTTDNFGTTLQSATLTTASQVITIPDTAGAGASICLSTGNCLGGGGGGANTALSNLASVSINSSLLSGSANTIDLGAAINTFRNGYFGTSALTPAIDTISAGTLSVGTATATTINIGKTTGTPPTVALQGNAVTVVSSNATNSTTLGFTGTQAAGNITYTLDRTAAAGSYAICTSIGNCLGGGGGGANTALSNLASVAINTDLSFATSGGTHKLTIATPAPGATGDTLTLVSASGNTTGSGGVLNLQGGASGGGATGNGGAVNVTGGNAASTNGSGGNLSLDAGSKTGSGTNGTVSLGGTTASAVTVGNAASTFALTSTGLAVTTAGAVSGVTTLVTSSTINTATISGGSLTSSAVNSLNVSGTAISGTSTLSVQSTGANTLTLDTGGASTVNVGTANATTINIGKTTGTPPTVALQGNAVTVVSSNATNSTTLGFTGTQAAGNITYTLDRTAAAGSYAICTSIGNCLGGGGGGANTALSNLASVAINTSLLSGSVNTIDLGASVNTFRTGYFGTSLLTPSIDTISAGTLSIATTTATSVKVGSTTNTGTLTFGQSTSGETISIANATVAAGNTNNISIGTSSTGTGKDVIGIGSANAASALTLESGPTGSLLIGNGATAHTISIGSGAAIQAVTLGSQNSSSTTIINGGTGASGAVTLNGSTLVKSLSGNSATAFQVQNNSGVAALSVDTTNLRVNIGPTTGNGTPTGQLYVSGLLPSATLGTVATGTNPFYFAVQGHYAYVVNNSSNNLKIIDISNPASPAIVGTVGTHTSPYAVVVSGHYAYVTNNGDATHGLEIFDISNPTSPVSVGTATTGTAPRELVVQGHYVFLVNATSATIQSFDITNPAAPVALATASTGSNPVGIFLQGRYAYVTNLSGASFTVFDISNPASIPAGTTSSTTTSSPDPIYVLGRYAYVVASNSGTAFQVWDISNPASPSQTGTTSAGTSPTGIYVQGRYAYVIYNGGNFQIFDISNPASPASVGTYATGLTAPVSIVVSGRYAYVTTSTGLSSFDLGGTYDQQLEAGGIETGTLQVDSVANFGNSVSIADGLNVGQTIQAAGGISTPLVSVYNASAAGTVFTSQVTADTNPRFTIGADGKLSFGGGSGATDVSISRPGVGQVQVNGTLGVGVAATSKFAVQAGSAGTVVSVFRGAASQTADLLQNQDTNGAVLSKFDASGALTTNGTNTTLAALATPAVTSPSATGTNFYYAITATNAAGETVISNVLNMNANNSVINWTQIPGATGYKIYRHAATNDFTSATCTGAGGCLIQTITNGTTVTFTDAANALSAGAPPTAPTGTKLAIQGWASQTSNTLEIQDQAGTKMASFNPFGALTLGSQNGNTALGRLTVYTTSAASLGTIIRGFTSQSADLLELQDVNGLVNASVNATGNQLTLGRVAGSGTVTQGQLVFSDGTTSNRSVKLQVGDGLTSLGANSVIQIPAAVGATDTVCLLTLSNCVGAGGAVSTTGGTQNYITKYNNAGATQLTNSQLFDNGSFVGVNTTTNSGQLSVLANGTGQTALFVQAPASSTVPVAIIKGGATPGAGADLLDINTSSTNVLAVDNAGNITQNAGNLSTAGGYAVTLNGNTTLTSGRSLSFSSGTGGISQTYSNSVNSVANAFNYTNTNTAAGTNLQGMNISSTNTASPSSGNNTINLLNFASGSVSGGNVTNGINFASTSGYTNFLSSPTAVLTSGGALSGLTGLTVASGGETITSGNLTVSSGNLAVSAGTISGNVASATALQIQNGATTVLNVDTTNQTLTVRAGSDAKTLGAELYSGNFGANWTTTNWTLGGGNTTATHNTGNTSALVNTGVSITSSATYQVSFTVSGTCASGQSVTPSIGGTSMPVIGNGACGGAYVYLATTVNTTGLTFTPTSTWLGTISAISIKQVTGTINSALTVQNASGTTNLEVRASSGASNTFVGLSSGSNNVSGANNTTLGALSLQNNISGGFNTALGNAALQTNTTGSSNIGVGYQALNGNSSGNNNVAVGRQSLLNNVTGGNNVGLGYQSLLANTNASGSVAVGSLALKANTSGAINTALGYSAGYQDSNSARTQQATIQGSTAIGAYAIVQASNSIVLGSVDTQTNVGIGTTVPLNLFSVSPVDYNSDSTGITASQTGGGTTITATSGIFNTSMIGEELIWADGSEETISNVPSNGSTTATGSSSAINEAGQSFRTHVIGLQVTSAGNTYVQNASTTGFQVLNGSGTAVLAVDTTNNIVKVGGSFDQSASASTFKTGTGAVSLNGDTTVATGKALTVTAGVTSLTGLAAGSSTALAINTGAASNAGLTVKAAASQTADLFQLQDSTGALLNNVDANGNLYSLGNINSSTASLGQYGNMLNRTEMFDNGTWTKTNVTAPTANTVVAPNGATTAESLADSSSGGSVSQTSSTAPTNANYNFSVWLKTSSSTQAVDLRIDGATTGTGTKTTVTATTTWQRFSVTQNTNGFTGNIKVLIFPGGTGGSGTVSAWGAQLTQSSVPLGYSATDQSTSSVPNSAFGAVVNGDLAVAYESGGSATALTVKNTSGDFFTVDSSASHVVVGSGAGCSGSQGRFCVQNTITGAGSTNVNLNNSSSITTTSGTGNNYSQYIIQSDTSAAQTNNNYGVYYDSTGSTNTGSTTVAFYAINKNTLNGGAGSLIQLQAKPAGAAVTVFNVDNFGAVTTKTQTNTTAALQVQNASSKNVLTVDTTNGQLVLGDGSASGVNGKLVLQNSAAGSTNVVSLSVGSSQSNALALNVPLDTNTTDDICLKTLANCAGAGSGVTATGYTQNYVTKFNGTSNQITVSQLFDNGSFVGVNTTTNSGQLSVLANGTGETALFAQAPASSTVPVAIIKGGATPGGSADILDLQTSSSTVIAIDNAGNFTQSGATNFGTGTGAISLNGSTTIASGKNLTLTSGSFSQTYSSSSASTASNLSVTNNNTGGAGVAIQGISVSPTNNNPTSGTNTLNVINLAAGSGTSGTAVTNGINFASATGYTNFIHSPSFNLDSAGAITGVTTLATSGAINGQTISSTASFTGTVQAATSFLAPLFDTASAVALNVGTSASQVNLNQNTQITGNLSFLKGANRTISVGNQTSGNTTGNTLTIQSGAGFGTGDGGAVTIQAATSGGGVSGNGGNVNITAGNASSTVTGNGGNVVLTAGTASGSGTAGAILLGSNVTVNANNNFIYASGTGTFDQSASSGTFATGSGSVSLNGATTIGTNKTLIANGSAQFKDATAATTAFQVQNTLGDNLLNADTTNPNTTLGLTNSSFETNTTGWAAKGSCTLTRITSDYVFGIASAQCANTSANDGMKFNLTLANSTQYTLSFYAKISATNGNILNFGYAQDGATETGALASVNNNITTANGWKRYSLTFSTTTTSGTPYIFIKQNDATTRNLLIDGVQIEATSAATNYREGSLALDGTITSSGVVFRNAADTTTGFQIQSASGQVMFDVDTNLNRFGIGTASPAARFDLQANTSTVPALQVSQAGTSNILQLQDGITNVLTVSNTGATVLQNQTDSTAALQIQKATTAKNVVTVDTSNGKLILGDGTASGVNGTLVFQNAGNANAVTITNTAQANAVAIDIPADTNTTDHLCLQLLANCHSGTLQNAYDNSSPATILLASAKDFKVDTNSGNAGSTGNILFNLTCTVSCAATGRFAIQNSGTDIFTASPSTGSNLVVIGSTTNGVTFGTNFEPVLNGTARHTLRIALAPEFPNATMTPDGSSNTGVMTSDSETSGSLHSYYNWTTTQATAQDYDIWVKIPIPSGFSAWASGANPTIYAYAKVDSHTNDAIQIQTYDSTGTSVQSLTAVTPGSDATWVENSVNQTTGSFTYTAGGFLTLKIHMSAAQNDNVKLGEIRVDYLSKY